MSLKFLQIMEIIVPANTALNNIYPICWEIRAGGERMVNTLSSKNYLKVKMFVYKRM